MQRYGELETSERPFISVLVQSSGLSLSWTPMKGNLFAEAEVLSILESTQRADAVLISRSDQWMPLDFGHDAMGIYYQSHVADLNHILTENRWIFVDL